VRAFGKLRLRCGLSSGLGWAQASPIRLWLNLAVVLKQQQQHQQQQHQQWGEKKTRKSRACAPREELPQAARARPHLRPFVALPKPRQHLQRRTKRPYLLTPDLLQRPLRSMEERQKKQLLPLPLLLLLPPPPLPPLPPQLQQRRDKPSSRPPSFSK
jgi:hypothetical protein